jgi:4-hydroxymandelate oxidase
VRAAEAGADGVVVSNHGGRQLDTSPPTIEVLPEIVDALAAGGHRIEVLLDGGIRRGTDILKALALGARAVLVGRAILWGLAVDGEAPTSWVWSGLSARSRSTPTDAGRRWTSRNRY